MFLDLEKDWWNTITNVETECQKNILACHSLVVCASKSQQVISSITQNVYCVPFASDDNAPFGK